MTDHPQQLPIPDPAAHDGRAVEILRVWAAGGKQHVAMAAGLWDDPAAWGIMLVDLAKHVAGMFAAEPGWQFGGAIARLREGFDAEWHRGEQRGQGNKGVRGEQRGQNYLRNRSDPFVLLTRLFSEDGGLEEVAEFFPALANAA